MKVWNTINICIALIAAANNGNVIRTQLTMWVCIVYTFIIHIFIGLYIGVKNVRTNSKTSFEDVCMMLVGKNESEFRRTYYIIIFISWCFYQTLINFIY